MRNLLLILLAAGLPLWAQLETDTITITASRQVNLQPDQIVFNVQVLAGATATVLAQLQQQSKQTVQFYAQETRVSPALQQSQGCSQVNLVSDARTQAQNLSVAAGFSVGPVLAVSDASGPPFIPSAVRIQTFASFLQVGAFLPSPVPIYATPPLTCAAVVKFRLFRYH
jgi:uncharacterized protein YggE